MGIALVEPALVKQVEEWGNQTNRPVEKILETAVQTYLDKLEREAIHAETQIFWEMQDDLFEAYPGQYVALYQGQVVAHDEDLVRLEEQVREQFGPLPVLIAPVSQRSRRDLVWLGGHTDQIETT